MRLLLSILCFFFSVAALFARPSCDLKFYTGAEGFRNGSAIDILQARNGLIWISTRNGLSLFDGYSFRNYKSYPGDGCAMDNSRINLIRENTSGDIWCLSQDGRPYLFDVSGRTFMDVFKNIQPEISHPNIVSKFFVLEKGITWVICRDRYAFRAEDDKCKTGEGIVFYGPEKGIKGESIHWVAQDKEGDEWILTNRGICIIGKKKLDCDVEFQHFLEKDSNIWLASNDGKLAKYSLDRGNLEFIDLLDTTTAFHFMQALKGDTIALGTNNGLLLINSRDNTRKHIVLDANPVDNTGFLSVYQDAYHDYWLFAENGVYRYEQATSRIRFFQSPSDVYLQHEHPNKPFAYEDPYGHLWLIPGGGNFCYFDREQQKLRYYYSEQGNASTLISPSIRHYLFDQQGNIWIGTNSTFGKISFYENTYRIIPGESDELEVRALFKDKRNVLWVASKHHKLKLLDEDYNKIDYKLYDANTKETIQIDFNIYSIIEDHAGNIWLGSRLRGLYLLKRDKQNPYTFAVQHFIHNSADSMSLSNNSIYTIFQDSRKRIWLGTYGGGLNLIEQDDAGKFKFIHSGNRLSNYPSVYAQIVRYITEANNTLLFGSMHGLFSFSSEFELPEDIRYFRNVRNEYIASSLSNNDVMFIYSDSGNQLYLLTQNGGVNKVVSDNLLSDKIVFEVLGEMQGLASDLTLSMAEDPAGNLWIASKQDLSRYNSSSGLINNFGSYYFKQNFIFSESEAINTAKGTILFGTNKGILEINPSTMSESNYVPPLVFTEIKLNNHAVTAPINQLEILELRPKQRNFSIQFSALDFNNSKEIDYAYMLEGLEKEWHYVNENRSAEYIKIPKGHFRFLVKSTNSDGVWVENERQLAITVLPTFWETPWAWVLYIIFFALLVSGIVYVLFVIYRLRHEVTAEQQLSEIKLRFFTDISHELRTPLTLISSPVSDVLEHEELSAVARENLTIAQHNSKRLLHLVNQILDFRKIQANKMKLMVEETEICGFISLIMENFQFKAKEKDINYLFDSREDKIYLWIDKDKFEKIIFNLLSNAFKYTPPGKSIRIELSKTEENLKIAVHDEGIGIPTAKISSLFQRFETLLSQNILLPSSGIGLSLVKELVELHHGKIEVYSETGKGSSFSLLFPLGSAHFTNDPQVEFLLSDQQTEINIPPEEQNQPGTEEENQDKRSILIVEDNPELMSFLHNILSRDYRALQASNGLEGWNKTQEMMPDIIISDIVMPVMDGLDMVKKIKENNNTCHIPIILLSSKASLDDRIKALEKGIDDYITKPFSASHLTTRIQTLLEQRKLLQDYYLNKFIKNQTSDADFSPGPPIIASYDENLIKKVIEYIEQNIDNALLVVEDLAQEFSMSRSVFYKKIKSLFGLSPVDLIRNIRIKRAVQLIDNSDHTFTEIAYMCGFNDLSYFGKCFKKQIGLSPSEYKLKNK
ncbi:MAG: two-component regulator propeller domain-containing protein [Bacteroidales bacterium]|nr:two-component regulator propeller domain-containing protein [Bacteroidales bacterium]